MKKVNENINRINKKNTNMQNMEIQSRMNSHENLKTIYESKCIRAAK